MTLQTMVRCTAIHKKSKSPAFKDLQIGDRILFSCDIKASGRNHDRTYATYINCKNKRTGEESNLSFNQIDRILKNFEFEELVHLFVPNVINFKEV